VPTRRKSDSPRAGTRGNAPHLTTEAAAQLCDSIRLGLPKYLCAKLAGVSRSALFDWLYLGRTGYDELYSKFYRDFTAAEAEGARDYLGIVHDAAAGGTCVKKVTKTDKNGNVTVTEELTPPSAPAAQWVLERRFARDFGPNRLEVMLLEATNRALEERIAKLEGKQSAEQLERAGRENQPGQPEHNGATPARPGSDGAPVAGASPPGKPPGILGTDFEL